MVQVCGEAILVPQTLPKRLKKAVLHLDARVAAFAHKVVVGAVYYLILKLSAAQVGGNDHPQVTQQLEGTVHSCLVSAGVALLDFGEDIIAREMSRVPGQHFHHHQPSRRQPVAVRPQFAIYLGGPGIRGCHNLSLSASLR